MDCWQTCLSDTSVAAHVHVCVQKETLLDRETLWAALSTTAFRDAYVCNLVRLLLAYPEALKAALLSPG
jgi:hypothetical protein